MRPIVVEKYLVEPERPELSGLGETKFSHGSRPFQDASGLNARGYPPGMMIDAGPRGSCLDHPMPGLKDSRYYYCSSESRDRSAQPLGGSAVPVHGQTACAAGLF